MKGQNTDEIKDQNGLQDLDFAIDITAQLTDLNLNLQDKNKLVEIKFFITKLSLWIS